MTQEYNKYSQGDDTIRASGRQIDYAGRLDNLLDLINQNVIDDVYNDVGLYNNYRRLIVRFEGMICAYTDISYEEEVKEIVLDFQNATTLLEKIDNLDARFNACMRLMKRKGFTPADDSRSNSYVIVHNILQRIRKEFDALILVMGERGTGKSTLAIKLAQEIAEKRKLVFDVEQHLFFDPLSMREYIYNNRPARGQPLVWDEAGAGKGMGRRRAMTRESVEFNEIIQVIREMGLIIFYTAPSEKNLDSGTINMFSHKIDTIMIHRVEQQNLVKFYERDGLYWKYPKGSDGNRVTRILIDKPDESVIDHYKRMKKSFMYDKVKVKKDEKKKKKSVFNVRRVVKKIIDEGVDDYRGKSGVVSLALLQNKFRVGRGVAAQIKAGVEQELKKNGMD